MWLVEEKERYDVEDPLSEGSQDEESQERLFEEEEDQDQCLVGLGEKLVQQSEV